MNEILNKNLTVYPKLEQFYLDNKNSLYPIEYSKNNFPTLKINNIYLHSKYDPIKESEKICGLLLEDIEELDVLIIYGAGLGYAARSLFQKLIKENKSAFLPNIIYIEKDIKIFLTSLCYFDWSEIFNNENFKIFLDTEKETIGSFIQTIPTKRVRYYHHRPSFLFNEEYYKNVQIYLEYILDRKDMNIATFTRFQKLWTKNFIYNLNYYPKTKTLEELTGAGKGTTSVIVAGGPSLDENIDYLKKVSETAVIIAVDTVYKFLKKHDINVDILVTVDPQFWNYKYVENIKLDPEIVIAESSTYPKIFSLADTSRFFIGSSIFPLVDFFDPENKKRGTLAAGGSVATSAFDAARIIGSDTIVCIGLDLSFPKRMTHFKGSYFEKNFLNISDYFQTAETHSYKYLAHTDMRIINSTNGKVFTDQKMFLFKKWFDREIALTKGKVFMPDCGGAMLEGALIVKTEELPAGSRSLKDLYIKKISEITHKKEKPGNQTATKKIEQILKHAESIKKISDGIIKVIPENGDVGEKSRALVEQLEKELFAGEERSEVTRIISSSAQDILLRIMENVEYSKDEVKSAWIKTKRLNEAISGLSVFYLNAIKKMKNMTCFI